MSEPNIKVRAVAVSKDLDQMVEKTRIKLGMNRSAFYKYAMIRLLEDLSVLTEAAHTGIEQAVDRGETR